MDFYEVFEQVLTLLQRHGRVSYRALKRQFDLDDEYLEDLKVELIEAQELAIDQDNKMLVWTGENESVPAPPPTPASSTPEIASPQTPEQEREPLSYTPPHLAEKILQSKAALEGERKQVTVLFCDLANSTAIAEKIGPENMHSLLNRFFELALDEVHRYEGTINQFLGDGFMALFGAPVSHEDHARRAVLSALALQRILKEAELGQPHGVECKFRMGLNSGLVVVGSIGDNLRMDYSAIGDTTNLTSRLQQIAEPGEILISGSTSRLVAGYVRLEALQPVQVKGKTEPVAVFKVIGTLPRRSPVVSRGERTLSQFVGRERELAVLDELLEQVESGQGQVVGVVAEAGAGKSRLLYEFRQRLEGKRVTYLEGRCLSYGSTIPYHPIIDVVRNNCGITEADNPETIIEKVRLSLQEVGLDAEESTPYLLQLLGVKEGTESIAMLTPEAMKTRTFDTLQQMSLSGSQRQPLVFEIEDLHWIDKTSEDYWALLVESLAGAAILLVATYRPGYRPPWVEKSYATQISLRSLASQDALIVVHSTSQHAGLPEHLEQTIIEKSQGNPFFLEELTRAVIEHGDIQADMTVPDTIQGVLSARIDRLPEEPKRLLQAAAVLGREFSPRLLKEIWEGIDTLEPLFLELKRLEFLYERIGAEEPLYVFKHALTQEVAYESLLTTRRQILHAAAGQALESLYLDRLEDVYDRLAYHYANTDNAAKAVEYLSLVAEKAARGYAHTEAVASLQEALVHAERLLATERDHMVLDLVVQQAEALTWAGHHQGVIDFSLGWQERLERLQEPRLTGRYYLWLGHAYSFTGKRDQAMQSLQRGLEEGTRCGDALLRGLAHSLLSLEDGFAGRLLQAVDHGQQAVAPLEQVADRAFLCTALYILALCYYFLGDFVRGIEALDREAILAETIGDRRRQTNTPGFSGWIFATQGEGEMGVEACQRALEMAPDAYETAIVFGWLGYAYLEKGDLAEAILTLEQAVEQANQYRSRQVQSWFKTYLGEAYRADGQIEKARDLALQGFQLAQDAEHPWGVALAQRTLGRIAHTSGNLTEAENDLKNAMETFSSIEARYELARTHLDLAALAHTQNNHNTATMHLNQAYTWFKKLQVPKWVEKTEQLAREYGVTLKEVALEELTEGDV
jgi:class 3 adenylate cyclase/tetratricopeptide (TPR) repeat protein